MNKIIKKPSNIIYIVFVLGILLYLGSIIWINLNGRQWFGFDIYSDAMTAKYMSESRSFFPDNWVFGNQYYIVATPVIAALINFFLQDAYLSLGIASCIMTLLTVGCYIWCIKPFVNNKSLIVGLFCLIGGTIFGIDAANNTDGLQVFFTMASYYSCYVIGILFTLGLWLRLYTNKNINFICIIVAILLNLSLGMQSLRETLVLNIPLCMLAVYVFLIEKKEKINNKEILMSKGNLFIVSMLIANLFGIFLIKLFTNIFKINNHTILKDVSSNLFENIQHSFSEFLVYTGLNISSTSRVEIFHFISSLFVLSVVLYSLFSIFKSHCKTPVSFLVIFCLLSLSAVFFAGIFVIKVRTIYFFVWYLLVTFSFVYVSEKVLETTFEKRHIRYKLYIVSLLTLLLIGFGNYYSNFRFDFISYNAKKEFYKKMTAELQANDIKYLYSDWRVNEAGVVSAFSNSDIICGTFLFNNFNDKGLVSHVKYLCSEDWYKSEYSEHSYIMLFDRSLEFLDNDVSAEYREEIFSNLTFQYKTKYEYAGETITYYFYKGSDKFYDDLMNN